VLGIIDVFVRIRFSVKFCAVLNRAECYRE